MLFIVISKRDIKKCKSSDPLKRDQESKDKKPKRSRRLGYQEPKTTATRNPK